MKTFVMPPAEPRAKIRPLRLIFCIFICHLAGIIGAWATQSAITTWYVHLSKPFFTPPNWLFAPAWLTLYTLMGIAVYIISQKNMHNPNVKRALQWFGVQLVLNALWSVVFFGLHSILGGLINISLLWVAIVITMLYFFRISKTAGLLLMPYIVWVSYATALNFAIWWLN